MSFIALSLGLDGHFFDDKLSNPLSTLRLLHYWPLVRPVALRAPADVGMHTCALCHILHPCTHAQHT
jgi:isopenicillin N synthase-like dioxygenase